jgi:hypothetical protein
MSAWATFGLLASVIAFSTYAVFTGVDRLHVPTVKNITGVDTLTFLLTSIAVSVSIIFALGAYTMSLGAPRGRMIAALNWFLALAFVGGLIFLQIIRTDNNQIRGDIKPWEQEIIDYTLTSLLVLGGASIVLWGLFLRSVASYFSRSGLGFFIILQTLLALVIYCVPVLLIFLTGDNAPLDIKEVTDVKKDLLEKTGDMALYAFGYVFLTAFVLVWHYGVLFALRKTIARGIIAYPLD